MQLIDSIDGFRKALDAERAAGRTVGLVPTMGYLHAGHASLMVRAKVECDVVATTIFVNPLQFGAGEDLASYPRDLPRDQRVAAESGAAYLFVPRVEEMFPASAVLTTVHVDGVSSRLEGAARPTHFDGVATVVAKLFAIAGQCRAYFGEKDFQQLAVVRRMATDLSLPVTVIGCPTIREPDGLAMSSRNAYLTEEERAVAPALYRALLAASDACRTGTSDATELRRIMTSMIAADPLFTLDYADVADPATFESLTTVSGEARALIAARLGRARLIDNIEIGARS